MTQRKAELLLAAIISARATSLVFTKIALREMGTFNLLFLRFLAGFILLFLLFFVEFALFCFFKKTRNLFLERILSLNLNVVRLPECTRRAVVENFLTLSQFKKR